MNDKKKVKTQAEKMTQIAARRRERPKSRKQKERPFATRLVPFGNLTLHMLERRWGNAERRALTG